jgi:hypothetical protein
MFLCLHFGGPLPGIPRHIPPCPSEKAYLLPRPPWCMFRSLPVVILAIALLLAAGCTEYAPSSVIPSGNLSASVSKVEDHWNPGLGCYWRAYGTVFNPGSGDAGNVVVYVQLIDTSSGNIRDAETLAMGTIGKGGSRSFELALDGDCDRSYRVEVRPVETS